MRKNRKKLRNLFLKAAGALAVFLAALVPVAVLAERVYPYENGYIMKYDLYEITVLNSAGVGAYTATDDEAIAFVSIFSYDGDEVKNCDTKKQDFYVYLAITASGGNFFKSTHSLLYPGSVPVGMSVTLKKNAGGEVYQ